jgi:histidyl-tRNA synthetase
VLGGERYDDLVGRFSSETIPATGFGLGFDRTLEAMQEFGILPELSNKTQVLVTVFSQELLGRSLELVKTLRQSKLNTEIYSRTGDKLEKQLKYADKKKIPWVVIFGEAEFKEGFITLKNMVNGEQKQLNESELLTIVKHE